MSCITKILEMKGDKEFLPIPDKFIAEIGVEGGGIYKNYEYLITLSEMGIRCGYVAVPATHALANFTDSNVYDVDLDVHGGVTFRDVSHIAPFLLGGFACDDIWIGFDCNHRNDALDFYKADHYFGKCDYRAQMQKNLLASEMRHVRDYSFAESQCKHMIDQIVERDNGR